MLLFTFESVHAARFTATFVVPRFNSSINVASFSVDNVDICVVFCTTFVVVCCETCCTIACFASPLSVFVVRPDAATIVIVLLLVFDNVLTFLAFRKASASARRRVVDNGAAGTTNAPCNGN